MVEVFSDRGVSETELPMPSLIAVGGVHHHLVRVQKRTSCGLIAEAGDVREVMHMCLLTGYGAGAVNPNMAFETIEDLKKDQTIEELK